MSQRQRRKKYIDAKVQGSLARRILFHWMMFVIVSFLVSFLLQVLSNPFRPIVEHLHNLSWTHGPFILVMIFLLPVFIVDTIKLSHRFAGPIYALRRAMREVIDGQPLRKLQFRGDDFWRDLADDYNGVLDKLAPSGTNKDEQPAHEELVGSAE